MISGSQTDALHPASAQEVAEFVRAAVNDGETLRLGRETHNAGMAPIGCRRLDLGNMATVVDYPARDMTITVQAGMPYSELSRILAEEGQQLPIDVVDTSTSVGALVAGNVAGPRQYGYGTLRDYVIGIEAVDGAGRVFHAGGRVVKNVAGYDLCRLMVGSRGTLAVLTQLTFKLKPKPEFSAGIDFSFNNVTELDSALGKLNTTQATPTVLDFQSFVNSEGPTRFGLSLVVEGNQQACDWQIEQLTAECDNAIDSALFPSPEYAQSYGEQADRSWQCSEVRLKVRPSQVAKIAGDLAESGYTTKGHAGSGILYVHDNGNREATDVLCHEIAARCSGIMSTWRMNDRAADVDHLQSGIRTTFDPHSVFVS